GDVDDHTDRVIERVHREGQGRIGVRMVENSCRAETSRYQGLAGRGGSGRSVGSGSFGVQASKGTSKVTVPARSKVKVTGWVRPGRIASAGNRPRTVRG